jgi:hypothetical protein
MSARKIIGLAGYAGAGKDTAAAALTSDEARNYTRVSFADKLREFALAVDPLIPITEGSAVHMRLSEFLADLGGDWTRAKQNPEVRGLLQRIGTDAGRNVLGVDVWVDAALASLPDSNVIFTDCRFPNEAAAIAKAGGFVVRVQRSGVGPVNDHPSEVALDDWDYDAYVLNDADVATCRQRMLDIEASLS